MTYYLRSRLTRPYVIIRFETKGKNNVCIFCYSYRFDVTVSPEGEDRNASIIIKGNFDFFLRYPLQNYSMYSDEDY